MANEEHVQRVAQEVANKFMMEFNGDAVSILNALAGITASYLVESQVKVNQYVDLLRQHHKMHTEAKHVH